MVGFGRNISRQFIQIIQREAINGRFVLPGHDAQTPRQLLAGEAVLENQLALAVAQLQRDRFARSNALSIFHLDLVDLDGFWPRAHRDRGQSCNTRLRKAQAKIARNTEKKKGPWMASWNVWFRGEYDGSILLFGGPSRFDARGRRAAPGRQTSTSSSYDTWGRVSRWGYSSRVPLALHGSRMADACHNLRT